MAKLQPPPVPVEYAYVEARDDQRGPVLGVVAALLPAMSWLLWLWFDGADLSALNSYLGFFVAIALTVATPLIWLASLALVVLSIGRREGRYWIPAIGLVANAVILRAIFN